MGAWEETVAKVMGAWEKQKQVPKGYTPPDYSYSPYTATATYDNSITRNIVPAAEAIGEGYNRVGRAWTDPTRGVPEALGVTAAEGVGAAAQAAGGVIGAATDFVTPGTFVGETVESVAGKAINYAAETDVGQSVIEGYGNLSEVDQERLKSVGSLAEGGLTALGAGPLVRAFNAPRDAGFNSKGLMAASTDNFIEDYYGPILRAAGIQGTWKDALTENPKVAEAIMKVAPYVPSGKVQAITSPEQAIGAAKKAMGMGSTGVRAIKEQFKNLLFSDRRAIFGESGLSPAFQNEAKQLLIAANKQKAAAAARVAENKKRADAGKEPLPPIEKGVDRPEAKAGARAILQLHVAAQFGKIIPEGSPLAKFRDAVFLKKYEAYSPGKLSTWWKEQAPTLNNKSNRKAPAPEKVITGFETLVNRAHKLVGHSKPVQIVMKRPENNVSGRHNSDAWGQNNFNHQVIEDVFKNNGYKPYKTDAALREAVEKAVKDRRKKSANKDTPSNVKVIIENGERYLSSSRAGSAIVEGGIRSTHHVNKSGRVYAVLSDEHDFLEKIPVLNSDRAVGSNSVVAVTPTMTRSYLSPVGPDGKKIPNRDKVSDRRQPGSVRYADQAAQGITARSTLDDLVDVGASPEALKAYATQQKAGYAGLAGAGMLAANVPNEKQEEQ